MTRAALIGLILGGLAGCGGGSGDGADAGGGAPDATFCPAPPDLGTPGAADGDMSGRWAVRTITLAQVQGLGGAQEARTIWLQEATQTGTDLAVTETMCDLRIDSVDGLTKIRVTPAYIAAMPPESRTGSVVSDGSGGFDYTLEQNWILRGVTLDDEVNDELPTDPGDSRIGDWDGDSNPGVTLLIDGLLSGRAYVIQRDHSASAGTQIDTHHAEGLITWGAEQVYLGSDPEEIAELASQAFPDPDPNEHTFEMVRVPTDADCAWVVANACNLFE